jgi:divalent metal cation (Fe/Co/Zn/Cd) transporter
LFDKWVAVAGDEFRHALILPESAIISLMLSSMETLARYYRYAFWLGLFTVFYNLLEGLVSIFFGLQGEVLTLFGFGVDSFIEVLSGIGIIVMLFRILSNPDSPRTPFERTALRLTGLSLYLLSAGLVVTAVYNLASGHKPQTTLPGMIISLISIVLMAALVLGKRKVGRVLNSIPILADADCSLVCIYMSVVLLASSLIYGLTGIGFVDSIGAFGLAYFSCHEAREFFGQAKGLEAIAE